MTNTPTECDSLAKRFRRKLERDMGGELMRALDDPLTAEILLNADGRLWHECLDEIMRCIGTLHLPLAQAIIETVAGYHGRVVTQDMPLVEGAWPLGGARFSGQIPPVGGPRQLSRSVKRRAGFSAWIIMWRKVTSPHGSGRLWKKRWRSATIFWSSGEAARARPRLSMP